MAWFLGSVPVDGTAVGTTTTTAAIMLSRRALAEMALDWGGAPSTMAAAPTIAAGTAGAAATLGGTEVPKGDSRLRRIGGALVNGEVFPMTLFNFTRCLTFTDSTRSGMLDVLEFDTDCVQFEFYSRAANQTYQLVVDGKISANTVTMANNGSRYWVNVDFSAISASPVYRRIRIECDQPCGYAGVVPDTLGQIYAPSDWVGPRMVVLGDSFVEGTGATKRYTGFAWQLARRLGIKDIILSGFGGTGYNLDYYPGFGATRAKLASRITPDGVDLAADIYLIAMGINDPTGIQSVVETVLATLRAGRPGAMIYVLTPWNPSAPSAPTGAALTKLGEITAAANLKSRTNFRDVSLVAYTKSDATHPDQSGHDSLGESCATEIASSVAAIHVAASAPILYSEPMILGAFLDGQMLYCHPGVWTRRPTSFTFQWKLNGSNISGATGQSYAPQVSDLSGSISCQVTAANATGSTVASTAAQTALYGANILTNGDFSSGSTGWTVTGNWAVSGGIANHTTGAAGNLVKSYTKPASAQIRISFTLSGYSANAVTLQNNGTNVRSYTANGDYSEIVTTPAPGSPTVSLIAGSTFVGSIDNVQVRPVL